MSRSRLMWFGVTAALVFAARGASAQAVGAAFGQRGQVAISAERLLGVYILDADTEQTGTASGIGGGTLNVARNTESNSTTFVLLGNDNAAGPAAIPRLAVDVFVIDGLSIGGSLLYWNDSSETETTGTNTPQGGPIITIDRERAETTTVLFGFAPRVGYAYMFSPTMGIWPRGGITYVNQNAETKVDTIDAGDGSVDTADTETKVSVWSLSLEALVIISPFEHVAFGMGPFLDFGFVGDIETETNDPPVLVQSDGDLNATTFGVTSALIAWF